MNEPQLAVDGNSGKDKEFKDNVATVFTNPHSNGSASNGHKAEMQRLTQALEKPWAEPW